MFRLSRNRSAKVGERVEFKFSSLQALKVPDGWDKLFISIISVETGKTIAKSNKATACRGTCQWTEALFESIPLYQVAGMEAIEECLYKFVISMGSGRRGSLGEVVLNLEEYVELSDSGPLTLPLNKCKYDTILQVKIQCFNPKAKFRDENVLRRTNSHVGALKVDDADTGNKSDISDSACYQSVESFSSNQSGGASHVDEHLNMDTVLSVSSSNLSSNSAENSHGRAVFSPRNSIKGSSHIGRQVPSGSHVSATSSAGPIKDFSRSNHSSFNSKASCYSAPDHWQVAATQNAAERHTALSLNTSGSAKDLLEAAEETIDELRDEANMWKRHGQKLKIDLENLKNECSFKSMLQVELHIELSATINERDYLSRELEQLKLSLEETKKSGWRDIDEWKNKAIRCAEKHLEDELKYLKESNNILSMQLNKSQEANLQLVAVLEELEKTLNEQKFESSLLENTEAKWARKLSDKEVEINMLEEKLNNLYQGDPCLMQGIEGLRVKVEKLERDCTELTEEKLELPYKLKESRNDVNEETSVDFHNMPESLEADARQLKSQVFLLEELEKTYTDLEIKVHHYKDQAGDPDLKLREKTLLSDKLQQELKSLEAADSKYCDAVIGQGPEVVKSRLTLEKPSLLCEINKQLQLAAIQARNLSYGHDPYSENGNKFGVDFVLSNFNDEVSQGELLENMLVDFIYLNSLLQDKVEEFKDFLRKIDEEVNLKNENKDALLLKEREKSQVEEALAVARREKRITSKCLDDVRNEMIILSRNLDIHSSTNKMLEQKTSKLEIDMCELEAHIGQLEAEKLQLKAQLGGLSEEKESSRLELEDCKALIVDLKGELAANQQAEVEVHKAVREVSILQSDKSKLEVSLQELQDRVEFYETQIHALTQESENKVERLVKSLNASKQSEEILKADILHMERMAESIRSSEEIARSMANELELKLKASEYEKQQIMEECSSLKVLVEKVTEFQDEILFLKGSLEDAQFENEKLEDQLCTVYEECGELKAEKVLFAEMISNLQKSLHDSEDDRRIKIALEEKLLRLEGSCAQETETMNEIKHIKKLNSEHCSRIQCLDEEKKELMKKVQLLELELVQYKEEIPQDKLSVEKYLSLSLPFSPSSCENDANAEQTSKIMSLEAELKEMKERYLHMSLQYAEVEAEREELAFQLKSTKKEKRWFS